MDYLAAIHKSTFFCSFPKKIEGLFRKLDFTPIQCRAAVPDPDAAPLTPA
jgi:hypothetical protein